MNSLPFKLHVIRTVQTVPLRTTLANVGFENDCKFADVRPLLYYNSCFVKSGIAVFATLANYLRNTSNECNASIGQVDGYASTILHEEALYLISNGLLSVRHTRGGDTIPCSIPSIFTFCSELDCKGWLKIWMRVL
ncbi:hypothetical protein GJ496_006559 [Pomphorhynchus laevis]|nr:hypothetical protein GJ496_006559 [Pomphorhynchus laevis]